MEGFPCEAYYYRIGSNIRRLRRERQMTQEKLAEAAGLSLKMIQKLEVGQKGFRMETIINRMDGAATGKGIVLCRA